jgi:rhodanese-related sulfurtransferase
MDSGDEYILLDVRTTEEWAESRIDGSILIPDTEIRGRAADELPNKDALILVYCRTGRRSAEAANALIDLGYTNVFDFGGIIDWPYETVSGGAAGSNALPKALNITFDYARQSGSASNQFAVWIEDMDGKLVKTLYATRYTANGGYKVRPDSISLWVEKSGLESLSKEEVDAFTSATPRAGSLSYTWDLTDSDGNTVEPGEYQVFIEGSLRWKNRVLFSGVVDTSGGTPKIEAQYLYEGSNGQPALTEDSTENGMISNAAAVWVQ